MRRDPGVLYLSPAELDDLMTASEWPADLREDPSFAGGLQALSQPTALATVEVAAAGQRRTRHLWFRGVDLVLIAEVGPQPGEMMLLCARLDRLPRLLVDITGTLGAVPGVTEPSRSEPVQSVPVQSVEESVFRDLFDDDDDGSSSPVSSSGSVIDGALAQCGWSRAWMVTAAPAHDPDAASVIAGAVFDMPEASSSPGASQAWRLSVEGEDRGESRIVATPCGAGELYSEFAWLAAMIEQIS